MCYGLISSFTYFCFILKQNGVINVLLLKLQLFCLIITLFRFRFGNENVNWPNIFKAPLYNTVDTKLREFQYKYLMHKIPNLNPIISVIFATCALT